MRSIRERDVIGADGVPRTTLRLSPIDKLRLEMDEIWPAGANVAKDRLGRAHAAGFPRIMHGSWQHLTFW